MKSPILIDYDKNIIYIIICILSNIVFNLLDDSIEFFNDLSLLLSFIISLLCIGLENKNKFSNNSLDSFSENKKKEIEKNKKKEYFYVILLYFLFNIIPFLRGIQFNKKLRIYLCYSNITFIGIMIIGFFKKEKLFIHQIISLIVLFLCMFFTSNFTKIYKNNIIEMFIVNSLFSSVFYYFQGILRGYFKYSMENKFISPFFISSIDVGMNLIKNILVKVYKYFILNKEINYFNFKIEGKNEIIKCILFICCGISIPIFDILICYFYSPYHQCVCDISSNFIFLDDETNLILKDLITGILNIFFSCVASEIIVLNFCELDKNTKKEIKKRAGSIFFSDLVESSLYEIKN